MPDQTIDWTKYEQQASSQPQQIDWSKYEQQAAPSGPEPSFGERLRSAKNPGSTEGEGLASGLAEWDKASGGELFGGLHDIIQGNVSKGLHRIISGAGSATLPAAALTGLPLLRAAPIATGLATAGGVAGGSLAQSGAQSLGATPEQSELAGDVGSIVGGAASEGVSNLARRAILLGRTPESAYLSALKPPIGTTAAERSRFANTAFQEGIPVSKGGFQKLWSLVDDLNEKISNVIHTNPNAPISRGKVASKLADTRAQFQMQVNPAEDLAAIEKSGKEFMTQDFPGSRGYRPGTPGKGPVGFAGTATPGTPAMPAEPIPAETAQAMKQGTYRQLKDKAYGELQTAAKESQKSLARGLKDEVANWFPELNGLNERESNLLDLEGVLEKAVNRQANHQMMGIGTPILAGAASAVTGSKKAGLGIGLVKAVLDDPFVKSRLAIALSRHGVNLAMSNARLIALSNAFSQASRFESSGNPSPSQDQGKSE